MRPVVVLPFSSQAKAFCGEARQMLTDAGFELRCNESGVRPDAEELKELLSGAFAAVAGTEQYTADVIGSAKDLKALIRFGVGTDNLDLDALRRQGVSVGTTANFNSVAEFTLTLMLGLIKNLPRLNAAARNGHWTRFPMRELGGKTVGLVGFGRIGRRVNELLAGFGADVIVYDPFVDGETVRSLGAEPASLEELLEKSDIVSLHLPYTPEVRYLIDAEAIARMKDGAYLINTARGGLLDEKALYDALVSGKLSGAALDVYETEPVSADDPLLGLENAVFTPHASAQSLETNYNGSIICAQSIISVFNGGAPVYPVK
ncbi:MAG: phosphoglycerate dehydrogenase [Firmicutes bacterium]|nr:phosphoglycerate dehydrogenase [Bacillota bacterium]